MSESLASASPPLGNVAEDDDNNDGSLDAFRQQWQRELHASQALVEDSESNLERALILHREGEILEDQGNHADAIVYYRRAAKLVPDIEFKAFKVSEKRHASAARQNDAGEADESDMDDVENLNHLHRMDLDIQPNHPIDDPLRHLGALPDEVLHRILALTLPTLNDIDKLFELRLVCRKFYVLCRDSGLWHEVAKVLWPKQEMPDPSPYSSWQQLCFQQPRALHHGVYVSKASYVRQGEQSMDTTYRPFHLVKYYRYLRLFPNGTASALISSYDPQATVGRLKHPHANYEDIDHGHFELDGDQLLVVLHRLAPEPVRRRRRRQQPRHDEHVGPKETVFYMRFTISADKSKRGSHKLSWRNYMIQQEYWDGRIVTSTYDQHEHLKSFQFWRVKSYAVSE
eukprot:TRINITY_DN3994_c0_g1_i1.p1 TRINITY_DN3994_c0_g1~~TRINITY_DN3994_c0_g1_i1.p1  ORF type:complete len:399 (+),score=63.08 TRINITY_DN3994_c0_g1_i1:106-1302(+)